jgi:hypothetical protein
MAALGTFLTEEPRVALATVHKYPLKHCRATTRVTMSQLLSEQASGGLANSVAGLVSVARAHHVPLRIDEMNAVTCGGVRGVSDAFGSALWVLDTLFQMARVGVSGVNMHTVPNTINELIGTSLSGGHWVARVHPQYYGMMLFAQAAPAGARLLRVSGAAGALRVWATRASDGRVRVILINDDTGGARAVSLHIPAGNGGPAALERLEAPHAGSTSGVRLGGQSFGAQTSTGQLSGRPQLETVTPGRGGVYAVTLPAASAALLTLPAAG